MLDLGGLPVTSPARTVVDLARTGFRLGVVAADSALHKGLIGADELHAVIADCAGWPGITTAREVVGFMDGRSESVLESASRVMMRAHGVPLRSCSSGSGATASTSVGRGSSVRPTAR